MQSAADEFRPLYDRTDGKDGYVSLEVNPHLAHDTTGTIEEARRLWTTLNRPNVLIKVPATADGLPAIQQLISEGISVNVTLLFGLPRYRQVADAYIAGIEARAAQGKPVKHVASVASFFVSRIDTLVDPLLEKHIAQGGREADVAKQVHGQVAVASAKMAYQIYKDIFGSARFKKLADKGARAQRLLWASTGTKNPDYSDVKYVESLIGPDTVNTVPVETLDAYRDHGEPKARLEQDVEQAGCVLERLPELGISIDKVTQQLEDEGVEKFNKPFDKLMETLKEKTVSEQTRVSHPIYSLLPMEVEGFDSLAELALDMRWSWNHATDKVWRQLDPELWELTHNAWVVLQTVSRDQIERVLADPGFRRTLMTLCRPGGKRRRRPRGFSRPTRNLL